MENDRVETSLAELREACGALGLGEDRGTQVYEHLKSAAHSKPKAEEHPTKAEPKKPA